jgi:acetyl esterase/lipase
MLINFIKVTDEKFNNVSVRLYRPQNLNENEKSSAIVFIHGGYWFIYDVEDYDQLMYTLSNRTRSLVASIE